MALTRRPAAADAVAIPSTALAVLAATTFVGVSTENLPVGLLPAIASSLGTSENTVGLIVTGYAFVVALTAVPLIGFTRRLPRKPLLLAVMGTYALSNAVAALAPSFAVLLTARLIGGLCHGVFWSMIGGYAASLVGPDQIGLATSRVFVGNSVALAFGVPAGTVLGDLVGWRTTFAAATAVTLALTLLAAWVLPAGASRPDRTTAIDGAGTVRTALAIPAVRRVAAVTGLVMLGHFTVFTYVTVILREAGGSTGLAGPVLVAYGIAGVLGTVVLGRAYDRDPRRALVSPLVSLLCALAGLSILGGLDPGIVTVTATCIVLTALGGAVAGLPVVLQAEVLSAAGANRDAASSLYVAAFNAGIGGGALIGSFLLGGLTAAALAPVGLVLAASGTILARRRRR